MERTILLKFLKKVDINPKLILLSHQNNYVECLNVDDNAKSNII